MQRIRQLERRINALRPSPIIIEAHVSGELKRMTAKEFVEADLDFLDPETRIVSGNDLDDVRLILSLFPSVIE